MKVQLLNNNFSSDSEFLFNEILVNNTLYQICQDFSVWENELWS